MNLPEYISSGILEGYVLGTLSAQEMKEVECMSHIYPEIREEVTRLQSVMEQLAVQNAQAPRPDLKHKILLKIQQAPQGGKEANPEAKVIQSSRFNYYLIGAAAATIAVLIFFWWKDADSNKKEVASLQSEMDKWKEDYFKLETTMLSLNDLNGQMLGELKMFRNPEFKTVFLTENHPEAKGSMAIICWNKTNKSIMIAADHMPDRPDDKSFQLWAIVDGKPMDMGVLPDSVSGNFVVLPATVENPQAFAITLENKGGSPVPTLEQLYLAGNL